MMSVNLGLLILLVVTLVFIGYSYFRRDTSHLAMAAWSFIFFFPLLQVLIQRFCAGVDDAEEEVEYQLSGNVVKVQERKTLTATGTELFKIVKVSAECSVGRSGEIGRAPGVDNPRASWVRLADLAESEASGRRHSAWEIFIDARDGRSAIAEQLLRILAGPQLPHSLKMNGLRIIRRGEIRSLVELESHGAQNNEPFEILNKTKLWYALHNDGDWYRASTVSFILGACAPAVLNIYSIFNTPIQYHLFSRARDEPGRVGIIWVVFIEIPYMLFLLLFFVFTALQVGRSPQLVSTEKSKLIVRLSGLLKSLGRFSALNLLEFIHVEELRSQDNMQRVMSIIGAVIGFMAFRVKIEGIAFILTRHALDWTRGEWIRVIALINNMLSITNMKEKMMSVAIDTKEYRKDRWLEAVGEHLLDHRWIECANYEPVDFLHNYDFYPYNRSAFRAFKRLVTMGPDDVNRLFEDLRIDHKRPASSRERKKIPKQISSDCWNCLLTNIVGVVRCGLFYAVAETEQTSHQEQELLQGKVTKAAEAQKMTQRGITEMDDMKTQKKDLEAANAQLHEQILKLRGELDRLRA